MEIEYILSDHQREQIEPLFESYRPLLPSWILSATVRYDPALEDVTRVSVMPEYRRMNIQIGDSWFSEPPYEQRVHLIHEVCHTFVAPIYAVFKGLLEAHTDEASAERKWAEEMMRLAEESCVSDLSRVFAGLLR